jgi:type I restriction enzyme S subunit
MSEWKEYKLGDVIDVKHGFAFNGKFITDEPTENILVTPGNFQIGGGFKDSKFKYYNSNFPNEYILNEGDVVVTMTDLSKETDTLGYSAKIPKRNGINFLHNQRIGLVNFKSEVANRDFLYWLMRTREYQGFIIGSASGTSIMHTAPSRIQEYKFLLPPLSEQTAIAEVLNCFDDRIDLLHRQNKTLEQLVETLFRKWFVNEAENWTGSSLNDWILFDPREKMDKQKTYQMFDMKCLSNTDMSIGEGIFKKVPSGTSFRNGDTLLAKITPCLENGKTGFVMHLEEGEVAKGSTEFIVMRTRGEVSPYWIYCLARYKDFHDSAVLSMTGTSGRQRVQVDLLRGYEVKVDLKRMKVFHNSVDPAFKKIKSNTIQMRILTQLRDTLLPKLMSGDIKLNL